MYSWSSLSAAIKSRETRELDCVCRLCIDQLGMMHQCNSRFAKPHAFLARTELCEILARRLINREKGVTCRRTLSDCMINGNTFLTLFNLTYLYIFLRAKSLSRASRRFCFLILRRAVDHFQTTLAITLITRPLSPATCANWNSPDIVRIRTKKKSTLYKVRRYSKKCREKINSIHVLHFSFDLTLKSDPMRNCTIE